MFSMPSAPICVRMSDSLPYSRKNNGILLTVKVVPGSSRTEIVGCHGQMLKIKVAAPPEKGKANKALIDFLSGILSLKKAAIEITAGHTSSTKQVFLSGASVETVESICK